MTRRSSLPPAYTLVELLVALTIIGVLAGLLIPAVMGSRESARQAECQNRLKQIGIALASHESSRGTYPTGMRPEITKTNGHTYAIGPPSTQFQLLPFLEQATLFNAVNLNPGPPLSWPIATCPFNATAASVRLSAFLCPSDGGSVAPGNNYRACNGAQPGMFDNSIFAGGGGAFPVFKYLAPRDFTDGLSQTAGFSERVTGGANESRADWNRDLWFSGLNSVVNLPSRDQLFQFCGDPTHSVAEFWSGMGSTWIAAGYADSLYNHIAPPNWVGMDCAENTAMSDLSLMNDLPLFSTGVISARSRHRSGVNLLLMDGSVRIVRNGIGLAVWRSLGTRAGGEPAIRLD